jgi:hypothetical protein
MAKKDSGKYKVYAFMIPHAVLVISQDGAKLAQIKVEDAVAAKEKLANEQLNQEIIRQIKRPDYSTIWVDDPAGDPAVIEACKKMEQGEADNLLAGAVNGAQMLPPPVAEDTAAAPAAPQPAAVEVARTLNTIGMVFQTFINDQWSNIPGHLLKKGDVCRVFPERDPVDPKEWVLVNDPTLVSADLNDYLIALAEKTPAAEPAAAPQFKATEKTKVIDVECPETVSEENIKRLVRNLQSLEAEAQADAAHWRDHIKKQKQAVFAACNGKSFTHMECRIEEDWEKGVRRYIRPDNGEVALTEQIPYEERQLKMPLDEQKPEEAGAADGTESDENGTKPDENDTKLPENSADAPGSSDFPPPIEETASAAPEAS